MRFLWFIQDKGQVKATYQELSHHYLLFPHRRNKFPMEEFSAGEVREEVPHRLVFDIRYSHQLELMSSVYNDRVNKFISFTQIVLGSSIMGSLGNNYALGLLLVMVSAFSLVYQPGVKAVQASYQAKRYNDLVVNIDALSIEELQKRFAETSKDDGSHLGGLCTPADMRTRLTMGLTVDGVKLTVWEKIVSFIAGDLPKA